MSYEFDGTGYIDYGAGSFTNGVTKLSGHCWVKIDSTAADGVIFGKSYGSYWFMLWYDQWASNANRHRTYSCNMNIYSGASRVEGETDAAIAGAWQSVGFSWEANSATGFKLYIDGTISPYTSSTVGMTVMSTMDGTLRVGDARGYVTTNFDGHLSDAAMWDRILSAEEFAALSQGTPARFFRKGLLWNPRLDNNTKDWVTGTTGTISGTTVVGPDPLITRPTAVYVEDDAGGVSVLDNLRYGTSTPSAIYQGSNTVSKVYQGTNLLWG